MALLRHMRRNAERVQFSRMILRVIRLVGAEGEAFAVRPRLDKLCCGTALGGCVSLRDVKPSNTPPQVQKLLNNTPAQTRAVTGRYPDFTA